MRRSSLVLAGCAVVAAAGSTDAQQRALTLGEALTRAEKAAPTVVQAEGNVRATGAGTRAAWGEFLPSVSTGASYGSSFSEGPSRTDPITGEVISGNASSRSLLLGGNASFDLFTGFRRGADLRAARANHSDATASLAYERAQSALATTNQFLQALQGLDLVRVRQDAIRRAQEKLAIANGRLVTRVGTIADSLQAQVDLVTAQLNLLTDQKNLVEAEATLAKLVGLDGRVTAVADSSLFALVTISDTAHLINAAMDGAPTVVRSAARVRAARANLSIIRSSYFPQLTLSGRTSFSGSDRNSFSLFNNRSVEVGLSWNLFNGFRRESDVANRQATLDAATAVEADARHQVNATLTSWLAALGTAETRARLTAQNLETARVSARVQTERYRLGSIGIVEVNAAQDALSRAETDAVSARYDYLRAKVQIEAILGRKL